MSIYLKALQLKARHQVYTLLAGNNLSSLHGEGYDFSELREYQSGDDIRKINWTISAKLGTPYVKELHANRELSVAVAVLVDGSVYFNKSNLKQNKITEISTILAYATQQNSDLFRGFLYSQKEVYATVPTKQLYHIDNFSKKVYEAELLNTQINYNNCIKNLFTRLNRASIVFIVADFLEDIDLSILSQKHEVIVIIVRKREEEEPKKLSEITIKSPRNSESFETYFSKRIIEKYKAKLKEHDQKLTEHLSAYNIRFVKIYTDEDVISKLVKLFL